MQDGAVLHIQSLLGSFASVGQPGFLHVPVPEPVTNAPVLVTHALPFAQILFVKSQELMQDGAVLHIQSLLGSFASVGQPGFLHVPVPEPVTNAPVLVTHALPFAQRLFVKSQD
jgi:hypothetical protein